MKYYSVAGRPFTHYGKALSYARRLGRKVEIKRTFNIFKIMYAAI